MFETKQRCAHRRCSIPELVEYEASESWSGFYDEIHIYSVWRARLMDTSLLWFTNDVLPMSWY